MQIKDFHKKLNYYINLQFFTIFSQKQLIFGAFKGLMVYLFCLRCLSYFDVHFWPLLYRQKKCFLDGFLISDITNFFFVYLTKGVTMDHFFSQKCKESCWLKVYRFTWMRKNKILKKIFFPPKMFRGKHFFRLQ